MRRSSRAVIGRFSIWLTRDDLLGALRHMGLTEIEIGEDDVDHVNGPAISLVASRPGRGMKAAAAG